MQPKGYIIFGSSFSCQFFSTVMENCIAIAWVYSILGYLPTFLNFFKKCVESCYIWQHRGNIPQNCNVGVILSTFFLQFNQLGQFINHFTLILQQIPGRLSKPGDGEPETGLCQEYVIFDVNQAKPQYLLEYCAVCS